MDLKATIFSLKSFHCTTPPNPQIPPPFSRKRPVTMPGKSFDREGIKGTNLKRHTPTISLQTPYVIAFVKILIFVYLCHV